MSEGPLFITTDAVGGVWTYSVALARGMADAGRAVVLVVLGPPPDETQRAEVSKIAGCTLISTGLPLEWCLTSRAELDALIVSLLEHAIHVGASAAHLHAPALVANGWAMPVVCVAHSCMATWHESMHGSNLPSEASWHADATSQGLAASDAVVVPSRSFADLLGRVYRLSRHVDVIPNGLPGTCVAPMARGHHVLAAGRLWDPAKNMDVLEAAAAIMTVPVHAAGPVSAPAGSGRRFSHLVKLGNLSASQLHSAMSEAAVFASPARYEPFGLAVLEAAQRATPLVLSDIPTFRELWDEAAVFVPPHDVHAWARCLEAVVADDAERHRLGQAAHHRSRRYTQHAMVASVAALHHRVRQHALRAA